jgi:chromosome segregation ATPase
MGEPKTWEECIKEAEKWATSAVKSYTNTEACARMASAWVAIADAKAQRPDPTETNAEAYAGELAEVRRMVQDVGAERDEARRQCEEAWAAVESYKAERDEARRQCEEAWAASRDALINDLAAQHGTVLDLRRTVEAQKGTINALKGQLDRANERVESGQNAVAQATNAVEELRHTELERRRLEAERNEVRAALEDERRNRSDQGWWSDEAYQAVIRERDELNRELDDTREDRDYWKARSLGDADGETDG